MNAKLAAIAVVMELIRDDAFNDAWRGKSARAQDTLKRRLEAVIANELGMDKPEQEKATHDTPPTTPLR